MSKDNEPKRPNRGHRDDAESHSAYDNAVAPDTGYPSTSAPNIAPNKSASKGYSEDRPLKDDLDEARGETPSNEVEASLNPDEENRESDKTDK